MGCRVSLRATAADVGPARRPISSYEFPYGRRWDAGIAPSDGDGAEADRRFVRGSE